MNRRGKHAAFLSAAVGVVILVGVAFAGRGHIREEWYLSRLNGVESDDACFAVAQLLKVRSKRAIAAILERWAKDGKPLCPAEMENLGKEAIPDLIAVVRNSDDEVALVASFLLGRMGGVASSALVKELGTDDLRTYTRVQIALVKVGTPAVSSLRGGLVSTDERIGNGSAQALEAVRTNELRRDLRRVAANGALDPFDAAEAE
jgi:hypothetical protein